MDYSPYLEDGETEKSKLGWVVDTGLNVGKKLVITGVVISSVPLVLPPLVVISALGFAFSVPFGVVFASYACTEKLMSKLLPSPALSAYQAVWPDEEDAIAIEKEEKEQSQAMRDEIETRIELVADEYVDAGLRDDIRSEQGSLAREKFTITNKAVCLDVRECSDGKDTDFLNNVEDGGLNKEEMEQHSLQQGKDEKPSFNAVGADTAVGNDAIKTDDYALVAPELTHTRETKKCEGQNMGSPGEDASVAVEEVQTDKFMENENRKEGENFLQDKNEKVEKTTAEIKRSDEDKKRQTVSKGKGSSKEIERRGKKKTLAALKFPGKRKERPEGDKRHGKEKELVEETKTCSDDNNSNFGRVVEGEPGLGEKLVMEETSRVELGGVSSEKKQAGEKECIMLGSEDLENRQILVKINHELLLNDDVGNIDNSLEKEEKHVGFKDGALCETAEGLSANGEGVDKKIEWCTMMAHDDPAGGKYLWVDCHKIAGPNHCNAILILLLYFTESCSESRMIADDGDYSLEVAVLTSMPGLKHDEEMHDLKDEKDACAAHSGLHSDEVS